MDKNYYSNFTSDLILMKNHEDNESIHQCDALVMVRDITKLNIKKNIEEIKN